MTELNLPPWPDGWVTFATTTSLALAPIAMILIALMIIWWQQQTVFWFRIVAASFLMAMLLSLSSIYLFVIPPHYVACVNEYPIGCPGRSGYPFPVAQITLAGEFLIKPLDFALNVLMLWLLWLGATVFWRLTAIGFEWWRRTWRARLLFVFILAILPWALLPRVLTPPQPQVVGEELRLANNAMRIAEFTYNITGLWVQRLALEDMRHAHERDLPSMEPLPTEAGTEVCLRGYTYFFIPWQRYRIQLDPNGKTGLNLHPVTTRGSCWQ